MLTNSISTSHPGTDRRVRAGQCAGVWVHARIALSIIFVSIKGQQSDGKRNFTCSNGQDTPLKNFDAELQSSIGCHSAAARAGRLQEVLDDPEWFPPVITEVDQKTDRPGTAG